MGIKREYEYSQMAKTRFVPKTHGNNFRDFQQSSTVADTQWKQSVSTFQHKLHHTRQRKAEVY